MAPVIKSDGPTQAGAAALKLTDFMAEARAVVLEARKEAARIASQARANAEQAEREAAKRGYEEGFARGRNDGYSQGQASGCQEGLASSTSQAHQALSCAAEIAAELAGARGEVLRQAHDQMLQFALAVASKIVGRIACGDVSVAKENLSRALEMASGSHRIAVKVSPPQLLALREHCRQMVELLAVKAKVDVVADHQITPGGVVVLTQKGRIDATIETQLSRIAEALLGPAAEDGLHAHGVRLPGADGAAIYGQFISADSRQSPRVTLDESV